MAGATGPHYYQELYASPHAFDRIYLVDVRMQVSDDGGKTFRRMSETDKHSDNHSLAFRADDPDYLLVGTDGGIYESFDLAKTWRFVANLPVTQFYKVAVDDAEPFYAVYGGTQDNSTQGGPSRTDAVNGIRNADWVITLGGDGHQPATEPGNPDIIYSESQQGHINRVDRTTGETVHIQPQPEPGDPPERFNWDAPILVSPHSPTRIYYASQRVWRSDDRGDSWRPVSGDLTRDEDRMRLPLMERQWSWDSPWDMKAMSTYNTITSLAESPRLEGLLYAGTDDGLLQVSEDGGESWRKDRGGLHARGSRHRLRQRRQGRPPRRGHRLRGPRQPQVRRLRAVPGEEHRPGRHLDLHRRGPARPAPRLAGGPGPRQARPAVRRDGVRHLLHRRRRRPVGRS